MRAVRARLLTVPSVTLQCRRLHAKLYDPLSGAEFPEGILLVFVGPYPSKSTTGLGTHRVQILSMSLCPAVGEAEAQDAAVGAPLPGLASQALTRHSSETVDKLFNISI